MLPGLYAFIFLCMLMILLKKKRNVSFVFVYFLSSSLYYFHAFGGSLFWGEINQGFLRPYPIDIATYGVLFINLFLAFFACIFEKERYLWNNKKPYFTESFIMKLFFLGVLLFSLYISAKYNIFSRIYFNKGELLAARDSLASYYKFLASFAFVYIWTTRGIRFSLFWKAVASFPLLTTFALGHRSFLIISLCCVLFNYIYLGCLKNNYSQTIAQYLIRHLRLVLIIVVLIFTTFIVKGITTALFSKNYDLVSSRLSSTDYYSRTILMSEPNTILGNLNAIVASDYRAEKSSYRTLWAYFFPLLTKRFEEAIGYESFTSRYQADLFGTSHRAGTYLGEAYAEGGYFVLALIVTILLVVLVFLRKLYCRCRCNITQTTLLLIAIDSAFYIHRNGMSFQFTRIRDYLYIGVFLLFFTILLSGKKRIYF